MIPTEKGWRNMAARRAHGEGSIFQGKDGRWIGFLDLGVSDATGKRRRRKVTGKTRKDVAAKLDQARADAKAGIVVDKRKTVGTYLDEWLAAREQAADLTSSTLETYRNVTRLYIKPHLGSVRLAELTPSGVEKMTSAIITSPRLNLSKKARKLPVDRQPKNSPRTAAIARAVLRRALTDAVRDGLVTRNVAQLARPPRQDRREGRSLTPEQARALLAHVAGHRLYPAFVLSLMLGLRRGELLGLQWQDIDLKAGTLTVRRQLQRVGGDLVITDTKTAGSVRRLYLPPDAVTALKAHQGGTRRIGTALVFTSKAGGAVDPDNWRRTVYEATTAALGERWSPHELRHSTASILLAADVDLKVVSSVLGHSSVRITGDVYAHLLGQERSAAVAIGKALGAG